LGDAYDSDDDGDGFNDTDDPAPLDNSRPGNFSSVESILSEPLMSTARQEAEAAGVTIDTQTGLVPPDISGYYRRADRQGRVTGIQNGLEIGNNFVGNESYIEYNAETGTIDSKSVSFTSSRPISYGFANGSLLRGENGGYSSYSRGKRVCTEEEANVSVFGVAISSGRVSDSGDLTDRDYIDVIVDTEGEITNACLERQAGNSLDIGFWSTGDTANAVKNATSTLTAFALKEIDLCGNKNM